ncbi:MAG: glycogen/starch synthase, partial [Planctomycetes bacterium]|nr:glycogen/starch synthase [Planctomycetota bacterium]
MRVLMIGWEFPPHISGGLGTACRGLVQGLVHEGVDVTFVVPRLFGDEEPGGARLLEASEALRPAARPAPPPRRAGSAPALPAGRTPGSVSVAV